MSEDELREHYWCWADGHQDRHDLAVAEVKERAKERVKAKTKTPHSDAHLLKTETHVTFDGQHYVP